MTDPKSKPGVPGLKTLLEDIFGIRVDDALKARIEAGFGTTYDDDPSRWTDIKRNLAARSGEDPADEEAVDAIVDRLGAEIGDAAGAPASWTADERAIYATRAVETALEEGGPEGLRDEARAWLPEAIEADWRLGLDGHARVTSRIAAAIDGPLDEDEVNDLMEDWLNLENGDRTRAAWIRSHPEGFRP
jgi:hypothetical protein